MNNLELRIKDEKFRQQGVTLLLAVLILASMLAISFSLATVLFIEVRSSADLLKSEGALYGATGVGEQALFNLKRHACVDNNPSCYSSNYNNAVTLKSQPVVISTSSAIFVAKIPPGTSFSNNPVVYNFCSATATSTGCDYGKIQINYIDTGNNDGDILSAYLCQFDATGVTHYSSAPCTLLTDTYWLDPVPEQLTHITNTSVSWCMSSGPTAGCALGSFDPTKQQELILSNSSSSNNIWAQIETWDQNGNPTGLPFVGETSVGIDTINGAVGRKIQVIVPNSP